MGLGHDPLQEMGQGAGQDDDAGGLLRDFLDDDDLLSAVAALAVGGGLTVEESDWYNNRSDKRRKSKKKTAGVQQQQSIRTEAAGAAAAEGGRAPKPASRPASEQGVMTDVFAAACRGDATRLKALLDKEPRQATAVRGYDECVRPARERWGLFWRGPSIHPPPRKTTAGRPPCSRQPWRATCRPWRCCWSNPAPAHAHT